MYKHVNNLQLVILELFEKINKKTYAINIAQVKCFCKYYFNVCMRYY